MIQSAVQLCQPFVVRSAPIWSALHFMVLSGPFQLGRVHGSVQCSVQSILQTGLIYGPVCTPIHSSSWSGPEIEKMAVIHILLREETKKCHVLCWTVIIMNNIRHIERSMHRQREKRVQGGRGCKVKEGREVIDKNRKLSCHKYILINKMVYRYIDQQTRK